MADSSSKTGREQTRSTPLQLTAHPVELRFGFESRQSNVGVSASVAAHLGFALLFILALRLAPQPGPPTIFDTPDITSLIFLPIPGPGGGGGGGGNKAPEPPRKAEVKGPDKLSVPVELKVEPKPEPKETPPEDLVIPVKPMAAADQPLPGIIQPQPTTTESQGAGSGGGAGTGTGTGSGSGQGSGLGPGFGGGIGGGAYRPGSGITLPRVLKEVKPAYTADAMRAKVQGSVWLECIVTTDGSISDVKVTRSLDPIFGLDHEAIKAARQWKFAPGMRMGEPVPVIITIELTFTLR
jgi:TonB family protein